MAQYLSNINLNGNEIQNHIIQPLGTAPTTHLKAGRQYFNTGEKRESIYDGNKWLLSAYMSDIESISGIADGIDTRLKAIEAFFKADDSDTLINKWNEIVEFLNATEGDTLDSILSGYAVKTRKITAGTGLTGGGSLEADRTISLATVSGLTAGTYFKTTVDAYGRVTSGSNPTTLSGFGITDAYTKTEIGNLINGLDVVSVTQTLTDGKPIATISVGDDDTILYAPATYAWEDISGKTSAKLITVLGFTPFNSANFTKANIKQTLGISDWALAASKPTYKTSEVAEETNLYFTNARAKSAVGLGSTAIGSTSSYIYWDGSKWATKALGTLAFKSSLSAGDVGATKKYATAITKGTATSYKITHSLGTRDVVVMVYDPSTYEKVMVDVTMTDANNVTIAFGSAPTANYRVVVVG